MDASEVKRLRDLEKESTELQNIVAKKMQDVRMLKDVNSRNGNSIRQNQCRCLSSNKYRASAGPAVLMQSSNTKRHVQQGRPVDQ
jgi:hypothetical protein